MKKRLVAILFSVALIIGLFPAAVYAEAPQGVPQSLAAPSLEAVKLIYLNQAHETEKLPAFQMQVKISDSVLTLDENRPADGITCINYYAQVDNGEWVMLEGGGYVDDLVHEPTFKVPGKSNTFYATAYASEYGVLTDLDTGNHTYRFKVRLDYSYYYGADNNEGPAYIYSDDSNVLSLGQSGTPQTSSNASQTSSDWSKASSWALPALQRTVDSGLMPGILKGADMTGPITREEFCELAVRLYEVSTGQPAEAASPNPFSDTNNRQILKAYELGITSGTSASTFSPGANISRQEMAVMLFHTIGVISPAYDYGSSEAKQFGDGGRISSWATESVSCLAGKGIFQGDAYNNFLPRSTATREAAVTTVLRVYDSVMK